MLAVSTFFMSRRILLTFLTLPTLVSASISASLWMLVGPAHAEGTSTIVTGTNVITPEAQNCKASQDVLQTTDRSKSQNALQAQMVGSGTNLLDPIAEFKFTDAESDAAVAKFGCDCPRHIRAIQAMASQSPCTALVPAIN